MIREMWSDANVWGKIFMVIMAPWIIGLAAALVILPIFVVYTAFQAPAATFTLETSAWECKSTYEHQRFTGKVWVTDILCADYQRREAQ